MQYQGKDVVAKVLDDIASHLSSTTKQIKDSVKATGFGNNNISKDFVPRGSTDSVVRRPSNSYSRKCTVVWLDRIPSELREKLQKGTCTCYTRVAYRGGGRTGISPLQLESPQNSTLIIQIMYFSQFLWDLQAQAPWNPRFARDSTYTWSSKSSRNPQNGV